MTMECFSLEVVDHVATITMTRPPVNAQNRQFRHECVALFDELHDREDVRAIILTGAGRAFSAGADLKERPSAEPVVYPAHNRLVRAAFDAIIECEKPVIAAVNGAAIGAGCVMALCCDILVVSEDAFLSMTEVDVGLAGGVRHTLRHFSPSDARLMIYTARRFTGPEFYRMNAASYCVPGAQLLATAQLLPVLKVLACGGIASALAFVYVLRLFARRLQGFTGDCLGTTQQLCEIAFYLGCALGLGCGL